MYILDNCIFSFIITDDERILKEIKYNTVTNRPNISCERFDHVNTKGNKTKEEILNEEDATPSIFNGKFT